MKGKESLLQADINYLLGRKEDWVEVNCPACQANASNHYGEKDGFGFKECERCLTVFTSPRPSPSLLADFYNSSLNYEYWNDHIFPATENVRKSEIFKPRVEKVTEELEEMGIRDFSLLEVGAAYGWFCEILRDSGKASRVIAVEPSKSLAGTCMSKGIETINLPIEQVSLSEQVDCVVAFEVIEHLFWPATFVQDINRLLKPGGAIFLSCPSLFGFDVSLLGLDSSVFQHEHLNYFHPDSMQHMLEECGFDSVQVFTPGELDVNIVEVALENDARKLDNNEFIRDVLRNGSKELKKDLQALVAKHNLSSHMWVSARKMT